MTYLLLIDTIRQTDSTQRKKIQLWSALEKTKDQETLKTFRVLDQEHTTTSKNQMGIFTWAKSWLNENLTSRQVLLYTALNQKLCISRLPATI